ncbi:protein lines-like [Pollicipes pollicipes]|uniref:protein lines-like n=1 Tax=Pollicipes pollicipes TaxID=41117 RepID=UPI0018857BAA|nr:protein lines-like [Pollicipes pollicipes]
MRRRVLDVLSGTARTSLELSRSFEQVVGLEPDRDLLQLGQQLRQVGHCVYSFSEEGGDAAVPLTAKLDHQFECERVEFWPDDPCQLPRGFSQFGCVLVADTLTQLSAPADFLAAVHQYVVTDGCLVIASNYDWGSSHLPKSAWLAVGEDESTFYALQTLLEPHFECVAAHERLCRLLPLTLRTYTLSLPEAAEAQCRCGGANMTESSRCSAAPAEPAPCKRPRLSRQESPADDEPRRQLHARALLGCLCPLPAGRCLALTALLLPPERAQRLLEALVATVLESERPLEVCHALNALQWLIEQHEDEPDVGGGERSRPRPPPAGCVVVSVAPDAEALTEIKCSITALLENRWVPATQRFCRLLTRPAHETEVLAFLRLWATIISVKNNLSIVETKSLYGRLEGLLGSLGADASPHVWRAILDLYAEVLCYGSTIALQDCVAEEPACLAHALLRQARAGRLLELVPYERGARAFAGGGGGGDAAGDRSLLQKTVLLLLKALAVTVKETRCESSSEASSARSAGGSGSEEQDMAIIERTLRDVVRRLDAWIKARLPFHPETPMSEWAVLLLCDQDDYLVEAMVCLLDLCNGLAGRVRLQPDFERAVDPHRSFVQFLETVLRDHDLLLDFLVSNETCFLLYLLRYLKYVRKHWTQFTAVCSGKLEEVMTVLIRLRLSLERLVARDLFPYNVGPILRLLEKCEDLYEHHPPAG